MDVYNKASAITLNFLALLHKIIVENIISDNAIRVKLFLLILLL